MSILQKNIFSKSEMTSLSSVIGEMEKSTSGEIRVVIRHHRHWKERKLSMHDLTLGEFRRLNMDKTRDRTGVLILLLLSEKKFHIIADEGIHLKVQDGTWNQIADSMSRHFKEGRFYDGVVTAIRAVGEVLAKHFPRKQDDIDELSNEIVED